MDQLIILKLIFFFILITYLVDIVLILWGEILVWSHMGVKGLNIWLIFIEPNVGKGTKSFLEMINFDKAEQENMLISPHFK